MLSLTRRTAGRTLAARFAGAAGPRRFYHDNIVEHYENPRNVGSFDKNDASVGTVRPCMCLAA